MGAGIAAGPHCRRCWHARFPAPELTASFRRSCPSVPALAIGCPPVRFAVWRPPQAGSSVPAPPSVLRRPQFLTTWAWQSLVPLPPAARFRVLGCCWRVSFSGPSSTAPFGAALAGFAFGRIPQGEKGPSARLGILPLASAFAGLCPRSCDHWPCRISLASGRRSGIRSQSFRCAIRRFQCAPQHAENGFNAYF